MAVDQEKNPQERALELVRWLVPDWRPNSQQILWIIRIAIVLSLLVAIGYSYGITLWDWIKLLVVPAAIAAGGLWFNRQQQERQREDNQQQQERGLEIENQRAQDEALQAYLGQMGQLLLEKERPLRLSKEDDEIRTLARAWTLTVLETLDGGRRKRRVLRFLYESGLISKGSAVVDLTKADLRGAELRGADLSEVALSGIDLRGEETTLEFATLVGADLRRAHLRRAHLREANLLAADLSGADLRGANLQGIKGIINEELERQAGLLEGTTMPNGQKYEEWLKDKAGRRETR